ncbi:MAG: hypothetical protein ACRDM1_08725 [Gaiellaceae bacterium]
MMDPDFRQLIANDRIETLRRAGRGPRRRVAAPPASLAGVEVRLCRVDDDPALERLAALEGVPVPFGRLVVAVKGGRLVAALPLGGGRPLADPFVMTAHLMPSLESRAAQLRAPRRRLFAVSAVLMRRSHA